MGGQGSGRRRLNREHTPINLDWTPAAPFPSPTIPAEPFPGASFVGWIGKVEPTRNGIKVTMTARFEDREDLKPMWDYLSTPVFVEITAWNEYVDAKDELEGDDGETSGSLL